MWINRRKKKFMKMYCCAVHTVCTYIQTKSSKGVGQQQEQKETDWHSGNIIIWNSMLFKRCEEKSPRKTNRIYAIFETTQKKSLCRPHTTTHMYAQLHHWMVLRLHPFFSNAILPSFPSISEGIKNILQRLEHEQHANWTSVCLFVCIPFVVVDSHHEVCVHVQL